MSENRAAEFTEDVCAACGKHLGYGLKAFHVGRCEDCGPETCTQCGCWLEQGCCANCDEPGCEACGGLIEGDFASHCDSCNEILEAQEKERADRQTAEQIENENRWMEGVMARKQKEDQ